MSKKKSKIVFEKEEESLEGELSSDNPSSEDSDESDKSPPKKTKYILFERHEEIDEDDARFERMRQQGIEVEFRYYPIFKKNKGEDNFWQIGYRPDKNEVFTMWGKVGGKVQTSTHEPEAKGKKNNFQQALQRINNDYKLKIESGYVSVGNEEFAVKQPMMAGTYDPSIKSLKKSKNKLAKRMINVLENEEKYKQTKINYPVLMNPKLDGMRLLVKQEKNKMIFRTRGNETRENFGMFETPLKILFRYLPQCEIDGEMYGFMPIYDEDGEILETHGNFQETISITNKKVHVNEKTETLMAQNIRFCIFDIACEGPYEYRFSKLLHAFQKMSEDEDYVNYISEFEEKYEFEDGVPSDQLVLLNSFVANNEDEIIKFQDYCVESGFEGIMIKKTFLSDKTEKGWKYSSYNQKSRCNNILKLKYFFDDEGTIVGVKKEKNADLAIFSIKAKNGEVFSCKPAATMDERRKIYKNKKDYIGRIYQYKHFGLTEDGKPRFPTGIGFPSDDKKIDEYEED